MDIRGGGEEEDFDEEDEDEGREEDEEAFTADVNDADFKVYKL